MSNYALEVYAHFARWMLHLRRQPTFVVFSLIQPFMWLFLFSQALKAPMAQMSGRFAEMADYEQFIAGAAVVMTVFNNSLSGGVPVLFDREFGTLDRILTAPIGRSSLIVGRFLAVSVVSVLQVAVVLGLAAGVLGVTLAAGWTGALAIVGLALLFGLGITALSFTLAFLFRSHVEFFAVLAFVGLPLVFLSSALAPLEAMPTWLALLARANPMTYCIDAVRLIIQQGWEGTLPAVLQYAAVLVGFDVVLVGFGVVVIRRGLG